MGLICDIKQDRRYWDWEEVTEEVPEVHARVEPEPVVVRHSHSPVHVPTPVYVPTSPKLY